MGVLANEKHENFVQNLVKGMSNEAAWIEAGYSPNGASTNACALLRDNEEVRKRRDELLERAAYRAELKAEDIQEMLMQDRALARLLGQPSAAIRAAELLGKQIGMFVERKEIKVGALLDDLDPRVIDGIVEAIDAETTRRLAPPSGSGETGTEAQDVLPGDGAAPEGAVP